MIVPARRLAQDSAARRIPFTISSLAYSGVRLLALGCQLLLIHTPIAVSCVTFASG